MSYTRFPRDVPNYFFASIGHFDDGGDCMTDEEVVRHGEDGFSVW